MNFRFRERVGADAAPVFPAFSDPRVYDGLELPDAAPPHVREKRDDLETAPGSDKQIRAHET